MEPLRAPPHCPQNPTAAREVTFIQRCVRDRVQLLSGAAVGESTVYWSENHQRFFLPAPLWCCRQCEGLTGTETDLHQSAAAAAAQIISLFSFFCMLVIELEEHAETDIISSWNLLVQVQDFLTSPPTTSWDPARPVSVGNDAVFPQLLSLSQVSPLRLSFRFSSFSVTMNGLLNAERSESCEAAGSEEKQKRRDAIWKWSHRMYQCTRCVRKHRLQGKTSGSSGVFPFKRLLGQGNQWQVVDGVQKWASVTHVARQRAALQLLFLSFLLNESKTLSK